jgi:hypothetical protein
VNLETVETSNAKYMECGGKRSATPLWSQRAGLNQQKRRRRFALPAHSKCGTSTMRLIRRNGEQKAA